jgi:hypothetical protein
MLKLKQYNKDEESSYNSDLSGWNKDTYDNNENVNTLNINKNLNFTRKPSQKSIL